MGPSISYVKEFRNAVRKFYAVKVSAQMLTDYSVLKYLT
jgi:hypothetical protein